VSSPLLPLLRSGTTRRSCSRTAPLGFTNRGLREARLLLEVGVRERLVRVPREKTDDGRADGRHGVPAHLLREAPCLRLVDANRERRGHELRDLGELHLTVERLSEVREREARCSRSPFDVAPRDVLMLWHVPLYALSAWAIVQLVELTREAFAKRAALVVTAGFVVLVLVVGSSDLANSIRAVPYADRLNAKWEVARVNPPNERYLASAYPRQSDNRFYLRCDPPYDRGSEIWYLEEVLKPGTGWADAVQNHAFRLRPSCEPP
jgi:hypothetical protein